MIFERLICSIILTLIVIPGCKRAETRVVNMNNVMCRIKPDRNSKTVHIFSKGTVLKTKPTSVEFTFMNTTDVWHEVPEKNCFVFGGLLIPSNPVQRDNQDEWLISERYIGVANDIEDRSYTKLGANRFSKSECERIISNETYRQILLQKEVNLRRAACGKGQSDWACRVPEDVTLSCIKQ